MENLIDQLRKRKVSGALPCAKKTAELLRSIVATTFHPDASSLIDEIRSIGFRLQQCKPVELSIGNIVRRVLHLVREEAEHELAESAEDEGEGGHSGSSPPPGADRFSAGNSTRLLAPPPGTPPRIGAQATPSMGLRPGMNGVRTVSLSNLLDMGVLLEEAEAAAAPSVDESAPSTTAGGRQQQQRKGKGSQWVRKQMVMEAINELIDELDGIQSAITVQGVEHIHAKEVILTLGMSETTLNFLKEASKKREFQVVVAEGCPLYDGHTMAKRLSEAGIQTTLIGDAAIFAMMARANKVLVGAHALLANGGIIGPCGINMVALAARKHSVPFVVLVGLHKLSPIFPHDQDLTLNDFKSPVAIADYDVLADAFSHRPSSLHTEDAAAAGVPWSQGAGDPMRQAQGGQAGPPPSLFDGAIAHVPAPQYDYVAPNLVSLLITDLGGFNPSYVYRLLVDLYDRVDYSLTSQARSYI